MRARWPTQSGLAAFLSSFIAGGSGFRLCGCSDLRTCLLVGWWGGGGGAGALAVVGPIGVGLLDVFCSSVRFDVL